MKTAGLEVCYPNLFNRIENPPHKPNSIFYLGINPNLMKKIPLVLCFALLMLSFTCTNDDVNVINTDCLTDPTPDTVCTMDYTPVCGCDEVTYSNACVAGAAGVLKWTDGACK